MVRVDNGVPWGSCNDLPPQLALWIIGLGVDMHWNAPRRPQQNGVVERSQGLAARWAEPKQHLTIREFQKRIDHEDYLQRERLRAIEGQTRWDAYPELKSGGRTYSYRWEQTHWDWNRVRQHLSLYYAPRRVDCSGKIGHYGSQLYVGAMHKGLTVYVQFNPAQVTWLITDVQGRQLREVRAQLTANAVRTQTVPTH